MRKPRAYVRLRVCMCLPARAAAAAIYFYMNTRVVGRFIPGKPPNLWASRTKHSVPFPARYRVSW